MLLLQWVLGSMQIIFDLVLHQVRNRDILAQRFAFCKKYIACGRLKRMFQRITLRKLCRSLKKFHRNILVRLSTVGYSLTKEIIFLKNLYEFLKEAFFLHNIVYDITTLRKLQINCKIKLLKILTEVKRCRKSKVKTLEQSVKSFPTGEKS